MRLVVKLFEAIAIDPGKKHHERTFTHYVRFLGKIVSEQFPAAPITSSSY